MSITVNQDSIQEFIKLLIEYNGTYRVNDDHTVTELLSDTQCSIAIAATRRPIGIWYEGAPCTSDVAWLNPFKENTGRSPAREWFYNLLNCQIGASLKTIMLKLIDDCAKNADDKYGEFKLLSKIRPFVDENTFEEVKKIGQSQFISVSYNKARKTAEAQTELYSQQLYDAFPKIRKKTWSALKAIFEEIFENEDLASYKHTSKSIDIPETEAKLSVIIALITSMDPFAKDILGDDYHSAELQAHLEVLDGYAKLYEWAAVNMNELAPQVQQPSVYQGIPGAPGYPPGYAGPYQQVPQQQPSIYTQRVGMGPVPVTVSAGLGTNAWGPSGYR